MKYIEILKNMPEMDEISLRKEIERQGFVQRLIHAWRQLTNKSEVK